MQKQRIVIRSEKYDLWIISAINVTKKGPPQTLKFEGKDHKIWVLKFWKKTKQAVWYRVN